MVPSGFHEIWLILLFCILTWVGFSVALYLADRFRRKKEAMVGGLLTLLLSSVLAMLSGFAAAFLDTGLMVAMLFQLCGLFISAMAVSRVLQMLSWPRTWLAGLLCLLFYLLVSMVVGWGIVSLV